MSAAATVVAADGRVWWKDGLVFGSRIGLKSLTVLCRSLGTMLHSGVEIQKALELASTKTNDPRTRRAISQVSEAVQAGGDVSSAMRDQGDAFPNLLIDMVGVAEETGSLPEILASLADHYENNLKMRREFLSQIAWPMIQLVMAVLIIAFVIYLLGWIAESQKTETVDILGWGLTGSGGAITWLTATFGSAFAGYVVYQIVLHSLAGKQFLDPLLMRIPVLGSCMRSFGIARFSWAFALTQQAGMPIEPSLKASLRATANGAFIGAIPHIWNQLESGDQLAESLAASRLFPPDYIEMVEVAEVSGTVPEMLERMSPQFEDQARRSLSALVGAVSWLVWAIVAGFIVFVVFSIFSWYLQQIKELL